MSVEYYVKPEQGSLAGVSPAVLETVAPAFRLDDAGPGLHMTVCTAEPGSLSEKGLRLLASLVSTEDAGPAGRRSTA